MYCPVPEVDLRLPIVESEGCAWFDPIVVSHVAIGYGISLGQAVIGEIQVPILAAVSDVEKSPVPVLRQGKLHMIDNGRRNDAFHIAVLRGRLGGLYPSSYGNGEIRCLGQGFTGQLLLGHGLVSSQSAAAP